MDAHALTEEFQNEGQPKRWPHVLRQLCDVLDAQFKAIIPDELARWEQCMKCVIAIASEIGGCETYIPRGSVLQRQLRDHRMWVLAADHGWSENQLAVHYGMSERQVRSVISEQKSLRIARAQGQLFAA